MEAGVCGSACVWCCAVRERRGGGARQEGTSINDWAWTWAGWRRGGAATIGGGEHKNSPVKGSRLSGRVGLSLKESGQDGESDRDRASNVVRREQQPCITNGIRFK